MEETTQTQPLEQQRDEKSQLEQAQAIETVKPQSNKTLSDDEKQEIAATVEAILFSIDTPISAAKIAQVAELSGQRCVKDAIKTLNEQYRQTHRSFEIEQLAGGYRMMTLPQYHDVISRLFKTRNDSRLSQAAMETLSIVAYRQPVLRADIEAIRGVACGEVLRSLMEKQLVKIVGRAEVLGRPMLYGTTRRFLEIFGLNSLDELPKFEELRKSQVEQPRKESSQNGEDAGSVEETEQTAQSNPPQQNLEDAEATQEAQE